MARRAASRHTARAYLRLGREMVREGIGCSSTGSTGADDAEAHIANDYFWFGDSANASEDAALADSITTPSARATTGVTVANFASPTRRQGRGTSRTDGGARRAVRWPQ